jgi:hypothetical protein
MSQRKGFSITVLFITMKNQKGRVSVKDNYVIFLLLKLLNKKEKLEAIITFFNMFKITNSQNNVTPVNIVKA